MPKQKDLKRVVRSRMEKTGESYMAARVQVLNKKKQLPPNINLPETAGMSDAVVKKQTGRDWSEWTAVLDAQRMFENPHREIARYVSSLGVPDWWTQMVTVGYERIRGLRAKGQRRGGSFEASKSRTFTVPIEKLYEAVANARKRGRWLKGVKLDVRTANPNKTIRATFEDQSLVQFYFVAKSAEKSAVTVQHQKLPDKAAVDRMKKFWDERLTALGEIL